MAISSVDISNLYFFVDTIIPSTDDMPAASEVISVDDIKWILEETQKYEAVSYTHLTLPTKA